MSPERRLDFEMGERGKQEVSKQKSSNAKTVADPYHDMELRSVYKNWQDVNVIKWETGF